MVGSSELTIRPIFPPIISVEPYRKVMIIYFFFGRILSLSSTPSVTISDLNTTGTAYFAILIGSAEREEEHMVDSV